MNCFLFLYLQYLKHVYESKSGKAKIQTFIMYERIKLNTKTFLKKTERFVSSNFKSQVQTVFLPLNKEMYKIWDRVDFLGCGLPSYYSLSKTRQER